MMIASAILITTSESLAEKVSEEIDGFLKTLSRAEIIQKSLDHYGYAFVAENMAHVSRHGWGQGERGGLAGAGLRAGQQVVAFEHGGNGLGLDGRGRFVARFVHSLQDGRSQVQFVKCHVVGCARPGRRVSACRATAQVVEPVSG